MESKSRCWKQTYKEVEYMGEMSGNRDEQLSEIYDRLQELKNDLAEIVDNEFDEEQETEKTEALYDALEMLDDTMDTVAGVIDIGE